MASFFIDRPIFAWVVALFICLIGLISIPLLAIAQYSIIAPPSTPTYHALSRARAGVASAVVASANVMASFRIVIPFPGCPTDSANSLLGC